MAAALTLLMIPAAVLSQPEKAYASDEVYLEKDGQIDYAGFFTSRMTTNGVPAICAQPAKNSPAAGWYEKDYNWSDGVDCDAGAVIAALYYGPWSPGFDAERWPSTWYDGSEMTYDRYVVCAHIVISDRYAYDYFSAVSGTNSSFRNWVAREVVGYDVAADELYEGWEHSSAAGRLLTGYWTHQIPDSFRTFAIGGGSKQVVFSFDPCGWAQIQKTSANPSITNDNQCYSLEGIQYGVYSDAGCTDRVATLTCDANGLTDKAELAPGTYYVKEVYDSILGKGYLLDQEVHAVAVKPGDTTIVTLKDNPDNDPAQQWVGKIDKETTVNLPQGSAKLADAEFTIRYYDGFYDTIAAAEASGSPTRTWVMKTDADGHSYLLDKYKVAGDELYRGEYGMPCIPLGTVLIQETKAPVGYLLEGNDVHLRQITSNGQISPTTTFNPPAQPEQVERGDLNFIKIKENGPQRLAYVPFRLTSQTTGESHILVTDKNGMVDTSAGWRKHTTNTNYNDNAAEGSYDYKAGVWFSGRTDEHRAPVDDSLGALPYDTYTLEELPCEANKHYELIRITDITVEEHAFNVPLGTITDRLEAKPFIRTTAYDAAGMDKYVTADPVAGITDVVSYMRIEGEKPHTLTAELMYADDGTPVEVDGAPVKATLDFMPTGDNGKISIHIPFDARVAQGRDVVVFETLEQEGNLVAEHKDLTDKDQQVRILEPKIGTTATDGSDGDKQIEVGNAVSIKDAVAYSNLIPGKVYTLTGKLMAKSFNEDGEPFATEAVDANGNVITSTVEFTPQEPNGTVDVIFTFNAAGFSDGMQLVAFEQLYQGEFAIASHEDPEDEDQTVTIAYPRISTAATDGEDGDKRLVADAEAVIDDAVAYENLHAGEVYEVYGIVIDKATGLPLDTKAPVKTEEDTAGIGVVDEQAARTEAIEEFWDKAKAIFNLADEGDNSVDYEALSKLLQENAALAADLVHSKAEFTPDKASGTAHVTFTFDASRWIQANEPVNAVVYEALVKDGSVTAIHADINDEGQTVEIAPSRIGTEATDKADGDHAILPSLEATIVDTVYYENLLPGREYTVTGTLVDKETGKPLYVSDKPITSTTTFTPNASTGEVQLEFTFDTTGLLGKEIVAFESVSKDGIEVAVHEDIDDEAQTVIVKEGPVGTGLPKTGGAWQPWAALALIGAVTLAYGMWHTKRHGKTIKTNDR